MADKCMTAFESVTRKRPPCTAQTKSFTASFARDKMDLALSCYRIFKNITNIETPFCFI